MLWNYWAIAAPIMLHERIAASSEVPTAMANKNSNTDWASLEMSFTNAIEADLRKAGARMPASR